MQTKSLFKGKNSLKILGVLAVIGGVISYLSFAGSPSYKYYGTHLSINGTSVASPSHIISPDPFAGANAENTSFLPIWYTDELLKDAGITPTWDGNTLNLQVPSNIQVNYPSSPPSPMTPSPSIMSITINGHLITYAPRITYNDNGGGQTTFVPVFYLQKTFGYLGFQTGWDGTNWTVTAPNVTVNPVGQTYPDGWTAPVLTTQWSSDLAANLEAGEFQLFQNELGFDNQGHGFSIQGGPDTIRIGDSDLTPGSEVTIIFAGWGPDNYDPSWDPQLPQSYRIPVVAKQLFNFYFGSDSTKVWNYFNSNNIPDKFTANGRECMAASNTADGSVTLSIGYPNKPWY